MGQSHPQTLAEKLQLLFTTFRNPEGKEWSSEAVATGINAAGESTISGVYVHKLRTGQKDNPTKKHLEALAKFFGVNPAYFFDSDENSADVTEQVRLLAAMRDSEVRTVALRASGLSPEALASLSAMIDYSRAREGLPPAEDGGHQ